MNIVLSIILIFVLIFLIMTETLAAYPDRVLQTLATGNNGVAEFWDFLGGLEGTPFTDGSSGGVISISSGSGDIYYPGAIDTSVVTNGHTAIYRTSPIFSFGISSTSLTYQTRAFIPSLSLPSDRFKLKFGLANVMDYISPERFETLFVYDDSISANWVCKTLSSELGLTDQFVTSVPVDDQDHYFRIVMTPSKVYYYIDNILVHEYAMDFTAPTYYLRIGAVINKTNGSLSPGQIIYDAVKFVQTFSTPRAFQ